MVRAVPADVVPEDVEDLVVALASRLVSNPRYTTSEKTEWVLHSIACRAAIKAGDKTHAAQLLRLAEDVLDGRVPPFCPHGRPIAVSYTHLAPGFPSCTAAIISVLTVSCHMCADESAAVPARRCV